MSVLPRKRKKKPSPNPPARDPSSGDAAWGAIPPRPPAALLQAGRIVHLVSHAEGTLRRVRHGRRVRRLRSLRHWAVGAQVGGALARTTCFATKVEPGELLASEA